MKKVTLIISDLHMGDGGPGDDFVDDGQQFAAFLREQGATPEGQAGQIELIINGDFLEFVQVAPELYSFTNGEFWCTEQESLLKLNAIMTGHKSVFQALEQFQQPGNLVTLFAGNHDVDLYWKDVQAAIRAKVGQRINFELGEVWYERYGGKLRISHGHLIEEIDPANGFKHWKDPRLGQTGSLVQRLEMCPGTIFVVRFVNLLEAKYPFADNLHPETAIVDVLWREDRWGLKTVAWAAARFIRQFPKAFLSADSGPSTTGVDANIGRQLIDAFSNDPFVQNKVAELYREGLGEPAMTADEVAKRLNTEEAVEGFIEALMRSSLPWERWISVLNTAKPAVNAIGSGSGDVLAIRAAGKIDTRKACLDAARDQANSGAQVVVLGHTHLPQKVTEGSLSYYNPGSWTRYVDAEDTGSLTLKSLEDETAFPYQLNYVRVEDTGGPVLRSSFHTIAEQRRSG